MSGDDCLSPWLDFGSPGRHFGPGTLLASKMGPETYVLVIRRKKATFLEHFYKLNTFHSARTAEIWIVFLFYKCVHLQVSTVMFFHWIVCWFHMYLVVRSPLTSSVWGWYSIKHILFPKCVPFNEYIFIFSIKSCVGLTCFRVLYVPNVVRDV